MKKIVLILPLFALLLASCGKMEDPQFRRVDNFKVKQLGLQATTVGFSIVLFNPNNSTLSVKQADCDIYIDSLYMGKFIQDHPVEVEKKAEFSVPLTGTIPTATALKLDISKLVNRDVLLKATGSIKVGKAGIYFNRPFDYSGTHRINM